MAEKKKIADLKESYPIFLRWGIIGSLLLAIGMFTLLPSKINIKPYETKRSKEIISENIEFEVEDLTPPEPEAKPAVPVEAESEEEIEAATIAETSFEEVYTTPETAVEAPIVPFHTLERRPEPQYSPNPTYPQQARERQMEGTVIVKVLLATDGRVTEVQLSKTSTYPLLDNAAMEAARRWTFTPAMQRNKPVRVWVTIPFSFSLD